MTTVLVVSPHLDDAALSCGGAIHERARRGDRVVVATVFSDGKDHDRRRDEDRRALQILGAPVIHLGLFDAPERLGLARTHRAIVEEAKVTDADVALVRDALRTAIGRTQPAEIWSPLGVGDHVDHRVVVAALSGQPGLVLYEDRPYAFLVGAVRARLVDLGLQVRGAVSSSPGSSPETIAAVRDLGHAPDRALVREAIETLPHLRTYLADDDGARSRAWLVAKLGDARSAHGAELVARITAYDAETAHAVNRAVCAYSSQVGDLFGGAARVAPALRRAALVLATGTAPPHAERTFLME